MARSKIQRLPSGDNREARRARRRKRAKLGDKLAAQIGAQAADKGDDGESVVVKKATAASNKKRATKSGS